MKQEAFKSLVLVVQMLTMISVLPACDRSVTEPVAPASSQDIKEAPPASPADANQGTLPVGCSGVFKQLDDLKVKAYSLKEGACTADADCTLEPQNPDDSCGTEYRSALNLESYLTLKNQYESVVRQIQECIHKSPAIKGCTAVERPHRAVCDAARKVCRAASPEEDVLKL